MFKERLYDRAVELYEVGTPREEALIKLGEMRKDIINEDQEMLLRAGYCAEDVEQEILTFDKHLENYSNQVVNELYR